MNGLTLRINPSNKKIKNSMGFAPITFSNDVNIKSNNKLFEEFLTSSTADKQLSITKSILDAVRDNFDQDVMSFLSLVFLHAETKHPVKCFLARHITKNEILQQPFAEELAKEIEKLIMRDFTEYPQYIQVVSKIAMCIENFPAGVLAIISVEILLAEHLKNCLNCCIKTLSERKLSPTEKNEIYNISHLALRLLLFIVQKVKEDNATTLIAMFTTLRDFIKYLMFDDDSPMDTKSICGILYLSMELLEKGPDAWISILDSENANELLIALLENEAAQLSLYSAIATVVPVTRIQGNTATGQSALVCLTEKIMAIGERSSSESIFILGVTRSVVQISKMLDKVSDNTGSTLMEHVLGFVWGHLEHYMDSVRHLAAQALANVVRYCTGLERKGNETGLNRLFSALAALDKARKSYYVSVTSLAAALGASRLLRRLPDVIRDVIDALSVQAVQASATTALEILLQKHAQESDTETIYEQWVVPILAHVETGAPDSAVLSILENLMAKAVACDENVFNYILPHIQASCDSRRDLRPALVLLSVARKAGVLDSRSDLHAPDRWKGIISYDVLMRAAVDAVDETRILSLALVAESRRRTERFAPGELRAVLHYLRYNINAQSPNFRQLTLSLMNKFLKRLEDSYKVLVRGGVAPGEYYCSFVDELRALCFSGLVPGANYSRRFVSLQILVWLGPWMGPDWDFYRCMWCDQDIEALLLQLEDSYESNKALALLVLDAAPVDLLQSKKYRVSLDVETIIREASSLKPTDCVSAAYKLNLLIRKLPDHILQGNVCDTPEPVVYTLVRRLLAELRRQLRVCARSVALAARHGPMYGLLHCMGHLVDQLDASAISDDESWRALVSEMITTCVEVNAAVACVVNNSSPEGHLPMDAEGTCVSDHGNTGDVVLEDGRPVTAQMVLLCAWRSVKEVSLLLGTIASRLSIDGEGCRRGSLSRQQLARAGEHFTELLAQTKHRGAFEQAYVGFTRLLARLWRCRSPALHALPRRWLRALTAAVPEPHPARSATRRSAGLPFMIQALVTTELQVQGNPKCLHECMTTLLRLARTTSAATDSNSNDSTQNLCDSINSISNDVTPHVSRDSTIETKNKCDNNDFINDRENTNSPFDSNDPLEKSENKPTTMNISCVSTIETKNDDVSSRDNVVETRTHSLNILRALYRNSMLEESVAGYVGEGLMVALQGFEGDTWMERNSSTLLFSALMVRVFGVTRQPRADAPALRNTMTGRIFFLRHPQLYAFILNKLKEANSSIDEQLHPSLYPVLMLLGRLYPSSLEGTVSTLRLVALVPYVVACARSRVLSTRQLAARAVVPLISPEQYIPHLTSMFTILGDRTIKRNYCHGLLLQVTRLLDLRPALAPGPRDQLALGGTLWLLRQPCYVLADEYVKMINLIVWRFPSFANDEILMTIKGYLHHILFAERTPPITSGREVCLANCLYLYFVLLHKFSNTSERCELVRKALEHQCYEVVLATLNYLLISYKQLDVDNCRFQQHLSEITNEDVLTKLRGTPEYIEKLCKILQNNKYLECIQKTLKILTLEKDTQKYIVGVKMGNNFNLSDEEIINQFFDCIQNEHENLTHIYLESLSNFVTEKLKDMSISEGKMLEVIRVLFACSSSENSDSSRHVVVGFMEEIFERLLNLELKDLSEEDDFELKTTLWATMVTLLEDDAASVRQRAADAACVTSRVTSRVVASRAADVLRDSIRARGGAAGVWVALALLDFKSEVCMTDEISDECRVFDQNERYNIFLEECMWTRACAEELISLSKHQRHSVRQLVLSVIENTVYRKTLDKLCNNNIILFRKMINDPTIKFKYEALNPKIELFIRKIC